MAGFRFQGLGFCSALWLWLSLAPTLSFAAPDHVEHWKQPVQAASNPATVITPESCGTCHEDKLAAWSTSRHALAFSPGLLGQLLTLPTCEEALPCLKCHAPLQEQQEPWRSCSNPLTLWTNKNQPWLVESGVLCAGCHLRDGQILAPVKSTEARGEHQHQIKRVALFRDSRLCGSCHQTPPETAVNGKPVQNTLAEWQASDFAAKGVTCQSCHLPNGKHLFRGIHDPEMVTKGLDLHVKQEADRVQFTLRSVWIGHAFPTYAVAQAVMEARFLDRKGLELPRYSKRITLRRLIEQEGEQLVERQDTRLFPGAAITLDLVWPPHGEQIEFQLVIEPDQHYKTQVFNRLLESDLPAPARALLQQAQKSASSSRFAVLETKVKRKR